MTSDECSCADCAETCDYCGNDIQFIDEEGVAWCSACYADFVEREQQRANDRWMAGGSQ